MTQKKKCQTRLEHRVGYHLHSGNFTQVIEENELDEDNMASKEPQLYLCDDWICPVEVIKKPCALKPQEKLRARVAKNFLLVTLYVTEHRVWIVD